MRRRIKRNGLMGSEENSSRASALKNSNNNNNNNKKISQTKITNFFKPPNNEKKDTNEVQNNNKQENTAQNNKNIDKSWKLGTLNINNQYKLFKSEIEFVLINDMKIDIIALQEIGIKEEDVSNKYLKIKPKEYDTVLMHCKKSVEENI